MGGKFQIVMFSDKKKKIVFEITSNRTRSERVYGESKQVWPLDRRESSVNCQHIIVFSSHLCVTNLGKHFEFSGWVSRIKC